MKPCIETSLKETAPMIIWTNALGKAPIIAIAQQFGYNLTGEYLWAKRTDQLKENSTKNEVLLRVYETALILQKNSIQNNHNQLLKSNEKSIQWSVISGYHEENENKHEHPCHKPFIALEPLIRQWSQPNDLILDPFCGSGGILLAALKIGDRKIKGIEKLDYWVQKANQAIDETK